MIVSEECGKARQAHDSVRVPGMPLGLFVWHLHEFMHIPGMRTGLLVKT